MNLAKKMLIIIVMSVFVISFKNCVDNKPDDNLSSEDESKYKQNKIIWAIGMDIPVGENKPEPEWVDNEGGITEHLGKKYVWIKGVGYSKSRSIAKSKAIGDAQARVAESVKLIVSTQFARAWESLGYGEREDIEEVSQGLVATRARITLRGFVTIAGYKRQVAKILALRSDGEPDRSRLGKVRWEFSMKMGMPYENFVQLREEIINNMKEQKKPTERQQKLIDKIEKELKKLDDNPKEFSVKASSKNQGGKLNY